MHGCYGVGIGIGIGIFHTEFCKKNILETCFFCLNSIYIFCNGSQC